MLEMFNLILVQGKILFNFSSKKDDLINRITFIFK